jgi:tRNA A37 threonylcarbamoyladenosine modification protein TsaB
MYLSLSLASAQGICLLIDSTKNQIINLKKWDERDTQDHWKVLGETVEEILKNNSKNSLTHLFCVSGPGAFTGLRISAAFMQGLSMGLKIPLIAIPTYLLNDEKTFLIPIRHQKVRDLTEHEAKEKNYEFLKIASVHEASLCELDEKHEVWGIQNKLKLDLWPNENQLLASTLKALKLYNINHSEFNIEYGLGPKVFGKYI